MWLHLANKSEQLYFDMMQMGKIFLHSSHVHMAIGAPIYPI